MNLFQRSISTLRTWLGLGDQSDDRLTPSHGWLLPSPATVTRAREEGRPAPAKPPLP
jgi:hypothetical protein